MSTVAVPATLTGAQWNPQTALVGSWGGAQQQAWEPASAPLGDEFAALRECLADNALSQLPGEVHALVGQITWAQVAGTMRIAESPQWRDELTVSNSAMGYQMLWLLVGDSRSSPRKLQGGYHKALQKALSVQIAKPFEAEACAQEKRAAKAGGKYDYSAARVTVASLHPWSAPVDMPKLRAMMIDPTGAAAALRAAIPKVAATRGTLVDPLWLWVWR